MRRRDWKGNDPSVIADWMRADRPAAIAHRAGNDLDSLKAAANSGADVAEADVWLYRGRLEVRHTKTVGPVPVLWDRWELASGWAPRLDLETLLRATPPGIELMLDLKGTDRRLPPAVIEVASRVISERTYTVCSRNWALLEPFRDVTHVRVAHSAGSAAQLRALDARLDRWPESAVSIHQRLLTPEVVRALRDRGAPVVTWPVNSRELLHRLVGWGVSGAISDSLTLVQEIVASGAAPRKRA